MKSSKSIGLVLSGGDARGLTHVGVLKALVELNVLPTHISGTSAGAHIGGMYASGIERDEILNIIQKQRFMSPVNLALKQNGLFSIKPLIKMLRENLPIQVFEELPLKFYATACNIEDGVCKFFEKGDMIMPMVASSAVPLMFAPIQMGGKLWLDGGVMNNFPLKPLRGYEFIIGSNVSTWPENHTHWTRMQIVQRCFHLGMNNYLQFKKAECHVFIDPPVGHYNGFGTKRLKELAELGYEYTMQQKEKILELVGS